MTNDMSIATTIRDQIGSRAFVMMGAKGLTGDSRSLQFKIGSNAKRVTNVHIELAADDTYTVSFWNIRGYSMKLLKQVEGVYCDQLRGIIESETGLYLSL